MKFLIFLGSVRTSTPPRPARLGERVSKACLSFFSSCYPEHDIELIDPLDYELGAIFKPHFAYSKRTVPQDLDVLADKIRAADGYIMLSPEYNHSLSPALANLLNHFGSSLFSYKPSAIVTYSSGQWGGMRAAVGMRVFLSELGCLPVSSMVHIPHAQDVLEEDGRIQPGQDEKRWENYVNRTFNQLVWWAEACSRQTEQSDPHALMSAFTRAPTDRDAP
ncbi:NADPH-dependent FMN reductase [Marinomonas pollencensis]|uniref:NAD(P)H-dependent FMN reductase n=1 Tax=Marinomonas pollencensis TaxID=491954 RepID=A0A3E0DHK5_9GAMM|nr:NAD(P)H-dependent oxidoreductase [Marinomonas pollencensis]REG82198.1 NAD(P)H-dependent FMN reductase [Marinomonas pollencensis]